MSYTAADLQAINDAIKSGLSRAKVGDRDLVFRDLDEMQRVKRAIEEELNPTAGAALYGTRYPEFSAGVR